MESIHPNLEGNLAAPAEVEPPLESKSIPAPTESIIMLKSKTLAALVDEVVEIEIDRRRQEEIELLGRLAAAD